MFYKFDIIENGRYVQEYFNHFNLEGVVTLHICKHI